MTVPSAAIDSNAPAPELAGDGHAALGDRLIDDPDQMAEFTRWESTPGGDRIAVSSFRLSGITCAACALPIEAALRHVDGVLDTRVQAAAERAEVRWDPRRTRPSALIAAVARAGYGAVPDAAASVHALRRTEMRRMLWRVFVAGFCMMQVMMVATPSYFAAPGEIAPDQLRLLQWASWLLSLPVLLFAAGPFFQGALRALRLRRIGMDVPVALGLLVTFVASTGATFDPGGRFGHEVYFDSLAMFVFFLLGGRWFELRARHRAAEVLESALQGVPDTAIRVDAAGGVETVPVSRLRVGDRVRVPAGQAFVADGVLLDGPTHVDEALLTGESTPLSRAAGDAVCAGSVNLRSPVHMSVQRLGADTRHAGIVALVRDAMVQRPAAVAFADRMAAPFLWGVLLLAGLAAAAWSLIDPDRAVWVAVSVLIVTCPCALALATPASLLAASGALAKRGVLLRRLDALESLARVDTVVFDKTGTLTEDRLELVETRSLQAGDSPDHWLDKAASLAALSTHPLSRALATTGLPAAGTVWQEVEEHPGQGLRARTSDGVWFCLGRREWVDGHAADRSPNEQVWFGPEGHAAVSFVFAEAPRADAASTVRRLRDAGVRVAMLSGDTADHANALAARLGIDDVQGAASPESKLIAITRWQQDGRCVAMVGDGLNDAPVLARADVSFAFAHGASVSQAHADAVLLGGRLADVADAHDHALRTVRVMRQNLAWAAVYNIACVPLALAGMLPPWAAGLGMAASSLVVVLNAGRLARMPGRA